MIDWIRGLFGRSRTLRDDQISTNPALYAPGAVDDERSQESDYSGGSDSGGWGFGGGGDSGSGGSGNGGGS
jgi:hypothetical protein